MKKLVSIALCAALILAVLSGCGSAGEADATASPPLGLGQFDMIVSNPPYIPTDVMRSLPHEVKDFEPDLALEGGADGLDIFRRLLNAAPYMLRAGGLFACELYEGALDAAAELCRQAGLSDVRIVHDLTDRPRIVRAIVTEPKQRI